MEKKSKSEVVAKATRTKQKDLKKVVETTDFKPTPLMEKFVTTAVSMGSDNVAEVCRAVQMTEQAYQVWKKNPLFLTWMNEYANYLIRGDAWKLNNIGMKKAKQDHKYWESMQKIVGNITDTPNQTNIQNNVVVMPSNFIDKYKKGANAINLPKTGNNE